MLLVFDPGMKRPPSKPTSQSSSEQTSSSFLRAAIGIFAVALVVRIVHIWQVREAPFFTVLMGDAQAYDAWGQRIARGDWLGDEVFYQAPLYPYFLGFVYSTLGRDLLLVRFCQAIVGSFACVLLALTARRIFSRRAGIVAGLMLASTPRRFSSTA
jgi:4-amino-4-deoxy-L-arabinose transferase-like glycosyltransferase